MLKFAFFLNGKYIGCNKQPVTFYNCADAVEKARKWCRKASGRYVYVYIVGRNKFVSVLSNRPVYEACR